MSDANTDNVINRYIRPFLRGYSKRDGRAAYFGTDVFVLDRRPCGALGLDVADDGAVLLEVVVGISTPAVTDQRARSLNAGRGSAREPTCLGWADSDVDSRAARLHDDIAANASTERTPIELPAGPSSGHHPLLSARNVPLTSVDVPIGRLLACRDPSWVGGDVLTSNDALDRVGQMFAAASTWTLDDTEQALGATPFLGAQLDDLHHVLTAGAP